MSISSWSASSRWRFAGSEREQPGRRPFIAAPRHQLIGADKCARGFVQRGQYGFGNRRNGQPDTDTFDLDRTCVVSGKGVSVRLVLGGRCIIKKTKKQGHRNK